MGIARRERRCEVVWVRLFATGQAAAGPQLVMHEAGVLKPKKSDRVRKVLRQPG